MLIVPSEMKKPRCAGHEYGSSMYRFFFDESKIVAVGSENIAHDSGGLGINFRIGLKDLAQTIDTAPPQLGCAEICNV